MAGIQQCRVSYLVPDAQRAGKPQGDDEGEVGGCTIGLVNIVLTFKNTYIKSVSGYAILTEQVIFDKEAFSC